MSATLLRVYRKIEVQYKFDEHIVIPEGKEMRKYGGKSYWLPLNVVGVQVSGYGYDGGEAPHFSARAEGYTTLKNGNQGANFSRHFTLGNYSPAPPEIAELIRQVIAMSHESYAWPVT